MLKTCPSCRREVEPSTSACPHCGHAFQGGAKRTMMGLPALNPDDQEEDIFGLSDSRDSKSTQFGLPAQSRQFEPYDEDSEADWAEDEDYDSTSIVPMDQLNEQMEFDAGIGEDPHQDPTGVLSSPGSYDPRGTSAGIPAASRNEEPDPDPSPSFAGAWGLDEESSDPSRTAVARGDVFPPEVSGGFAQFNPPKDDDHEVGTLLGMSLNELEEKSNREKEERKSRSTQFALPAAQRIPDQQANSADESADRTAVVDPQTVAQGFSSPPADDRTAVADAGAISALAGGFGGLDEESEESPTQAWNPTEDPKFEEMMQQQSETKRKSKLERLREKKHLLKSPSRDTAKGLPALKGSDQTGSAGQRAADPRKLVPRRAPDPTPQAQDFQRTSSISSQQLSSLSSATEPEQDDANQAPAFKNRGLETPSSGVLKVPKRTNPPGSLRNDDTGVTGGGSYSKLKSRGETTSDQPAAEPDADSNAGKVPVAEGPQPGAVPARPAAALPANAHTANAPASQPAPAHGLGEESWSEDYAYAETGIAPAESIDIGPNRSPATIEPSSTGGLPAPAPTPEPAPAQVADPDSNELDPDSFAASNSQLTPFASSATGPKFHIGDDTAAPAPPNTFNSPAPSAPAAQQSGPPAGGMPNGDGAPDFGFSSPSQAPGFGGQMQPGQMQPGQMQPGQMQPGQMQPNQMQGDDELTIFVGRAQSVFGILSGIALLVSLYFSLQPFAIPTENRVAIALAIIAVSGVGGLVLSLFPVSPGMRGVAFGILAIFAGIAFALTLTATVASSQIALALMLAGVGLAIVAALFPVIGKIIA